MQLKTPDGTSALVWQATACVIAFMVALALAIKFDGCGGGRADPAPTCAPGTIKEVRDHIGVDKNGEFVLCTDGHFFKIEP